MKRWSFYAELYYTYIFPIVDLLDDCCMYKIEKKKKETEYPAKKKKINIKKN